LFQQSKPENPQMSALKKTLNSSTIEQVIHRIILTTHSSHIIAPQIKSEDDGEEEEKSVVFQYSSISLLLVIPSGVAWKREWTREECETVFDNERERNRRRVVNTGNEMMK
jgi:hypothetical protein